jgi:hypothetical protein
MAKTNGYRYCKTCGSKFQKYGFDRKGNQRWKCNKCNYSTRNINKNKTEFSTLSLFISWLLCKSTISEKTNIERHVFARKVKWCWDIDPVIIFSGQKQKVMQVDAISLDSQNTLTILLGDKGVIGYIWSESENSDTYYKLLSKFPAPKYLVCDGKNGILKTVKQLWPNTKVQRCIFHVKQYIRQRLTNNPKNQATIDFIKITNRLTKIRNISQANQFIKEFNKWNKKYSDYLKERTYIENSKTNRIWSYTHRNLRSANTHIRNLLKNNWLFTYLKDSDIPNTNNRLEGGINSRLSELSRAHRGISLEHEKRMWEWYLYSRSDDTNTKELLSGYLNENHS